MKTMKVALLATAALAAVSVSARADDAASIKAQLEALNARIAQLEAAPAVPTGYSLLTMTEVAPLSLTGEKASDVSNSKSHRISVLPTADMPAATTIDWDLEVRAQIRYNDFDGGLYGTAAETTFGAATTSFGFNRDDEIGVYARGRIRVRATTDTSVGTVGVDMRLQGISGYGSDFGTAGAGVTMNIAWGWWQMTPEWTLGGGYTGSLSDPGHGQDGNISVGQTIYFGFSDQEQMRLTYASGPLTWAIAIEDNDASASDAKLAVASRIDYAGDAFSASLSGYYGPSGGPDNWQVAAGADFTLGDMATLSANVAVGRRDWSLAGVPFGDTKYVGATAFMGFDITEATSLELSGGYIWNGSGTPDVMVLNGGIYWQPVDQLKMGLQADHVTVKGPVQNYTSVAFVTWFSY